MFAVLICVVSVAMVLLSNHETAWIPDIVITEMVYNFIHDHDVWPLSQKRHSSDADDRHPTKKWKQIQYNRDRAKKCMMDDWLGPIPMLPDNSFQCTCLIKRAMVDTIINHFAMCNRFWKQMVYIVWMCQDQTIDKSELRLTNPLLLTEN